MDPHSFDRARESLWRLEALRALAEEQAASPARREPSDGLALAVGKVILAGYPLQGAR